MIVLEVYLILCALAAISLIVLFVEEDIKYARLPQDHHRKFGPNYKSMFSWAMLFFIACPVVNLITLSAWLSMLYTQKVNQNAGIV